MENKLIIWDFDGVIADSEHLWIRNWQDLLNEKFGLNWDFETAVKYLGGISPKTKIENLKKLGILINDDFLTEIKKRDWEIIHTDFKAIEGVENILKNTNKKYCLATGGNRDKTLEKLKALDFKKYFPDEEIFTAEQVKKGKPAPDLFLYAAEKNGFKPENCIVVEDSLPGLTAGLAAGMTTAAFIGSQMTDNQSYEQKVRKLGVDNIFRNMKKLESWLNNI